MDAAPARVTFLDRPLPGRLPVLFWSALAVMSVLALAPGGDGGGGLSDKALHFGAFATLAVAGALTGAMTPSRRTLLFWAGVAVGIEIAQALLPFGRDPSVLDAIASFAGALFGMALTRKAADVTLRRLAICGAGVLAATLLVDAGYRALRGPVTRALLAQAFVRDDATPWPGAPAKAYATISLEGAAPIIAVDNASPRALALAPGLWPDREPGDAGVTIFMGHRNAAFRALGDIAVGETVHVATRDGARFDYVVTRREIVRFDASRLYPDAPGEQLALVTCWPIDATEKSPWRLVVYAARASDGPNIRPVSSSRFVPANTAFAEAP